MLLCTVFQNSHWWCELLNAIEHCLLGHTMVFQASSCTDCDVSDVWVGQLVEIAFTIRDTYAWLITTIFFRRVSWPSYCSFQQIHVFCRAELEQLAWYWCRAEWELYRAFWCHWCHMMRRGVCSRKWWCWWRLKCWGKIMRYGMLRAISAPQNCCCPVLCGFETIRGAAYRIAKQRLCDTVRFKYFSELWIRCPCAADVMLVEIHVASKD